MLERVGRVARRLRQVELLHRGERARQRVVGALIDDRLAVDPRVQVRRERNVPQVD